MTEHEARNLKAGCRIFWFSKKQLKVLEMEVHEICIKHGGVDIKTTNHDELPISQVSSTENGARDIGVKYLFEKIQEIYGGGK